MGHHPDRWLDWLAALVVSWFATGCILFFAAALGRLLGRRGLFAAERLMGMLLTIVAIEMLLGGMHDYLVALG